MTEKRDNPYLVQPVVKALSVLVHVAERGHGASLNSICKALGMPKTSAFRYLQTLVETGFLHHVAGREDYVIGTRLRTLTAADAGLSRLREAAQPLMQELARAFNETVNLAVRGDRSVVYVDLVEANRSLRMQAQIGASHPMHSTALGKAILAFLPGPEADAYLAQALAERTGRTLIERDELARQLRKVRRIGYSTETGENEDGAMCVGAPILDAAHYPLAAISVSAPLQRMSRSLAEQVGLRLVEVAKRISLQFGSGGENQLFRTG